MKNKLFALFIALFSVIFLAVNASAKEYVWDFENGNNEGIAPWSGHHSTSFEDGFMIVTRASEGSSGGISVKPSETLAASDYPYLVVKVLKPENGKTLSFSTYYVTGDMESITGDGLVSITYPEYSDGTYDYYIHDFSTKASFAKGNIKNFVFTVADVGIWKVDELILTNDLSFLDTETEYTGDYTFEFNGSEEPGVAPWSGNHSISFANGSMIIDRNSNGSSGGISITPQKKLNAANYPYMVIKVKKDNNNTELVFLTYYVTGEMSGITADGWVQSYKADYEDDTYAYYVNDFSEKTTYAKGNINNYVLTVGNIGKWSVDRIVLTDDLSFIGIKEEIKDENISEFRLDGDDKITTDRGTLILTPYIKYANGTEETDYSNVKYATNNVNAEITVSENGEVTVTGQINGELVVTASLPESPSTVEKIITITGQPERLPTNNYNVVMYGNSIRAHPPAPSIGWPEYADWGMAASSTEKDYAHRFVYYMEQKYGKGSVTLHPTTSIATLEWAIADKGNNYDYSTDTAVMSFINTVIAEATAADADIITFQMGENVGLTVTKTEFQKATTLLVTKVKEALPNAVVIVCTSFWGGKNKVDGMLATSENCHVPVALIHNLALEEINYARDAKWLENADPGVKNHPGDRGMDNIAKMIFAEANPILSTNSETVYTTMPSTVKIFPENPVITEAYGSLALNAKIYPLDASQDVVWSCDNKDIATVDKNGVVSAINNGTAVITAESRHVEGVKATIEVTITGQTLPHTVTYDKNTTDTVTGMPAPNKLAKENFVFDKIYPVRKAYRFMGWSLAKDGKVQDGADITEDTTVYAIWEKAYRWDFEREGYKEDFSANYGFNQYVRDGKYMAIATDTNVEAGEVLTFISPEIDINPEDYYALVIEMENSSFNKDTTVDLTIHTANGDVKMSKKVESTFLTSYEFVLDGISGTITGFEFKPTNIDCTVKLDRIEFCSSPLVRFDTNTTDEVSGMPSNIYRYIGETVEVPQNAPIRAGYTFLGWVTDKNSKLLIDEQTLTPENNIVLYAAWDKNDHFEMDSADDYTVSSVVTDETCFKDGILYMTTYRETGTADPIIVPKKLSGFTAESTSGKVEYRMKWELPTDKEHTKIYFTTTAGPNLSEGNGNHVYLDKAKSDGFETKIIDLSVVPTWKGDIKSFRFDPYNGNGKAEIDYIRFTDSEANIVTASGETRTLNADDKAYHIIRKGGTLAPVGKVEIENLALSGNIDMTSGYITVSDKIEISDDADYTVFTLDFDLHGISSEDEMYISGCEIPVTPVDGAKYIVKTCNGSGFVAFRNKDSNKLTFKAVGPVSSEFTVFATSFKGIRLNSASVIKQSDMRNGNICITLDGDYSRLVTLNNTKSLRPVFGAITIK